MKTKNNISVDYSVNFNARIYVGMKDAATKDYNKLYYDVYKVCQDYCNNIGWCVSLEKICYIYKNGSEMGMTVNIINYPRFPKTIEELENRTLELAKLLIVELDQCHLTVTMPNKTIMLNNNDKIKKVENKKK